MLSAHTHFVLTRASCQVRVVPVYALKFSFNDTFVDLMRQPNQSRQEMRWLQLMMAGTLAGSAHRPHLCRFAVVSHFHRSGVFCFGLLLSSIRFVSTDHNISAGRGENAHDTA